MTVLEIVYYAILTVPIIPAFICIVNNKWLPVLGDFFVPPGPHMSDKLVSVLIPARNEEGKIGACLDHVVSQKYTNLEILVLDDDSIDNTGDVVASFNDQRVRLIKGQPLPVGWVGKNWACHQLSENANGDFFIFLDADTILEKRVLELSVSVLRSKKIDLLTLIPRRISAHFVERLMFPFIDWAIFCWLPMKLAHHNKNPHLSATFGQFMFFKKDSYLEIGGHAAVRNATLDDFELGRLIKEKKFKWFLMDANGQVKTLPYDNNLSAFKGISRSVFPALHYRISILLVLSCILMSIGFVPILTFGSEVFSRGVSYINILLSFLSFGFMALSWGIVCRKFGHSMLLVVLFSVAMLFMVIVAYHSLVSSAFRLSNWKGRDISSERLRF